MAKKRWITRATTNSGFRRGVKRDYGRLNETGQGAYRGSARLSGAPRANPVAHRAAMLSARAAMNSAAGRSAGAPAVSRSSAS